MGATSASWREAGYAVSVLSFGVTDTDLQTFIGGLTVQRGPGRDFVPTNEPPPLRPDGTFDASGDPAMKFAQETGWTPVACPQVGGLPVLAAGLGGDAFEQVAVLFGVETFRYAIHPLKRKCVAG